MMLHKKIMLLFVAMCIIAVPAFATEDAFTTRCEPLAITFLYFGQPVIQVSRAQAAAALEVAVRQQVNQPIVLGETFAVWALKSNELQVHRREDPDGTKAIFSPDICGVLTPAPATTRQGQAVAIAKANGGTASALAFADSTGAVAIARASGGGFAGAFAQSSGVPGTWGGHTPTECVYIVQPGDTLQSIAARHNTTVAALSAANRLTDQDDIQPGTRLTVPCGTTTPPPAGQSGYPLCEDGNIRYVVQQGDTLYSISTRYGTSVAVIAAANGIDDPAYIFVGQTITIPCEL